MEYPLFSIGSIHLQLLDVPASHVRFLGGYRFVKTASRTTGFSHSICDESMDSESGIRWDIGWGVLHTPWQIWIGDP